MLGLVVGRWWAIPAAIVGWLLFVLVAVPLAWGHSTNVTLEPGILLWIKIVVAAVAWLGVGLTGALCFIGIMVRRAHDLSRGVDPLV
jgi:uncharacterized membrane protein YhaH (DUF805 family)